MPEARVYQRKDGSKPFDLRFDQLEARAAARVTTTVTKLGNGLRPDVEPVGEGIFEAKIDYGPGYRIYFALNGKELIVLLLCGNKDTQSADISESKIYWKEFKARIRLPPPGPGLLLKPREE